jgi:diguanylate cyclase (GGDEF)-like protein
MTEIPKQDLINGLIENFTGSGIFDLVEAFQLINNVPIEFAIYDLKGKYKYINDQYLSDIKLRKTIIGKDDSYLFKKLGISLDCHEERKLYFEKAIKEKKRIRFTEKLFIPDKNKTLYYKRFFQPLFKDENKQEVSSVCLFGNNLTAVILGQKELKYLAFHDKITGLQNKEAFYQQLDQIILDIPRNPESKLTAVLFCDLDNFKLVNDTLGHDVGDLVLKEVAERMKKILRKSDFIYRFGGDEFTIITRHLKNEFDASTIARKLIEGISQSYQIKRHKITFLTVSIGIVIIPNSGADRETTVKNADMAMYESKSRGKNQYQFFSKEMPEISLRRIKIENNLQGLVNNQNFDKECEILYQPILERASSKDYKIIGTEALLRWNNPEMGYMLPEHFLPVAEETNLISSIGDWVLQKSTKDIKPLIDDYNKSFYVSINLSGKQIKSENIISKLKKIIDIVDIKPGNIQLELNESTYFEDKKIVSEILNEIQKLGIKLAINDFGRGFGSLVYLQNVPANTLKIDRTFIKNLHESLDQKQLVKAMISLGYNLNKDIIAAGVETKEHLKFLNQNNCSKYQGFLFSQPVDILVLQELLKKKFPF